MKILKIETPNLDVLSVFVNQIQNHYFYRSNKRLYYDRIKTTPINMAIKGLLNVLISKGV